MRQGSAARIHDFGVMIRPRRPKVYRVSSVMRIYLFRACEALERSLPLTLPGALLMLLKGLSRLVGTGVSAIPVGKDGLEAVGKKDRITPNPNSKLLQRTRGPTVLPIAILVKLSH